MLPLLLALFTVDKPVALQSPILPPSFDGAGALDLAQELATDYPDRSPGGSGALAAAAWFRDKLRLYDLPTQTDAWRQAVPGLDRVRLQNVTTVIRGQSPEAIVVMAHRDDTGAGPGANDNATGTAALLELARTYARSRNEAQTAVVPTHTLVFLSTDGGAYGGLGALRYAKRAAASGRVVAVINLDTLAGKGPARLEVAGDLPRSPATTLVRTVSRRIVEQTGRRPTHPGLAGQLIDLAFPLTLYEQGPFVARGIPAVTITTGGTRPLPAFGDTTGQLNLARFTQVGKSAQEALGSLDQGLDLAQGTTSYVWFGDRVVRGWAIQLVLIALLVPFIVATVDLFALCRRQRIGLRQAARSLRARLVFWLFVGIVFTCFRALGAWPDGPPRPPNPEAETARDWRVLALIALLLLVGAGWLIARRRLVPERAVAAAEQVAGHAVGLLALGVIALLVVATNPFALLFLLPALHAWLWLPQVRTARLPIRLCVYALGLGGAAILLLSLAKRFELGLDAPWYLLALVSVGYVKTVAVVIALATAAAGGQLAALAAGRYAPYPEAEELTPGPIRQLVRTTVLAGRAYRRRRLELRRRTRGPGT